MAASPAWADDWYEYYARAEKALANSEWDKAVEELVEALARKGDSGARVRTYGMKVIAYFPYLKLGIAFYHLGNFEAAIRAFETEERLGAIQESAADLAQLERYRDLALAAREKARAEESAHVSQIVRESLQAAATLEAQGRLSEAMDELAKGLALDPDNQDALAKMEELRNEVVRREREARDTQRADELVRSGRSLLEKGDYARASSQLRQALEIRKSPEAQELFDRAQAELLARAQAAEDAEARQSAIASALSRAREAASNGQHAEALELLQPVLAMDPENREALTLQNLVLAAQEEADSRGPLEDSLTEAENELSAEHYERAISAANRALALDPGNERALGYISAAYRAISRRLLGARTVENIPPAIRFADFRTDRPDGTISQVVRDPSFRLSGVVIDNSPVELVIRGPGGRELDARSRSKRMGEIYITEFTLDDELAAGSTTYQLLATDAGGLTTSAEYAVVYAAPFYRSWWFRLGIVLIPLAVLAFSWTVRRRRRQLLVRRRFNPYIAGAPVLNSEMFFGRERLIARILQTIHNNSLLLYGERRIGKTSLQHHIKQRLHEIEDPDYEFFPVYVDLQGVSESRFFATLAEDLFLELEPFLDDMTAGGGGTESDYGYRDLVADLRKIIKVLASKSSKKIKLVLLIDEVDELNAYDPRINQRLRSLFMKSFAENLVAVVSGVEIRKQWDKEGSPWYNFFEEVEVPPIAREDAAELITRPIASVFAIEPEVVDRMVELTDCRPYRLQRLCVALVNRMYEEGRRDITVDDVEAVAEAGA
jgi:tetratricopeptide (TPR) repeat protein